MSVIHFPKAASTLMASLLVALCSCSSGGDGGGDNPSVGLSAGSNQSVLTSEFVSLSASAPESAGVETYTWRQTAGPSVSFADGGLPGITFFAPDRPASLELEVIGRRANGTEAGRDRVVIEVSGPRVELRAELRSTIDVRGGGDGRAIASAVHAGARRLFVIDGVAGDVLAYDVSATNAPVFAGVVPRPSDTPGFSAGVPRAVAAGQSGAVGITWTGMTQAFPGIVQFVDPGTLQTLAQVSTTGANPVDIEVTSDGAVFAVACAGDPVEVGSGDGLGYVTLIEVPAEGPGAIQVHNDVFPIVLNPFDGDEAALAQAGVRFFAANPNASVELTPRSVAISPDGATVWAACPENDALLAIDAASKLITDLAPLDDRSYGDGAQSFQASAARQPITEVPTDAYVTTAAQPLPFGGVTALIDSIVGAAPLATLRTVSAGGAALGPADRNGNGAPDVSLVDPDAAVTVDRLTVGLFGGGSTLSFAEDPVPLRVPAGPTITGQPGRLDSSPGLGDHDEEALDLNGDAVATSVFGARFGGGSKDSGSGFWLGESRRNGLWRFASNGDLLARFVPGGTPTAFGTGVLPAVFAQRRLNLGLAPGQRFGGFGAVAYVPSRSAVFAAVRLPLDNPDTQADTVSLNSRIARMVEISEAGGLLGEYVVVLESIGHALEGMTPSSPSVTPENGPLFLLESATDPDGFRAIFTISLEGATNLRDLSSAEYNEVSAALETTDPSQLASLTVPIVPVGKTMRADLRALGLGGGVGQPSALLNLDGSGLAVAFDDRFQLEDAGIVVGGNGAPIVQGLSGQSAQIATVFLQPNSADFSGVVPSTDGAAGQVLPIEGLAQPLDLASVEVDGRSLVFTANGGLARVLDDPGAGVPFDERVRVEGLLLDTSVFTGTPNVQDPAIAGNLLVSTVGSDVNGDGLVDRLLAFGGRSISLRERAGGEVWRSGLSLVSRAQELRPERVASAGTLYGVRPRSLAIGGVGADAVLAVALEEAGSVLLYDLSSPSAPVLAGVGSQANRPVDVDLAEIGGTTLFVTDEARGRIEIRRVLRP